MMETILIPSRIDTMEVDVGVPENWDNQKLVILFHGFNSGKGSSTYQFIADRLLENGIAYAKFSLPYHAERGHDDHDFTLQNCLEDCRLVEKAVREKFPQTKIGIIGRSFGGYLTLLRLKEEHEPYFSITLLSPAICMADIFKNSLAQEGFDSFQEKGYCVNRHKANEMVIHYALYEELEKHPIASLGEYDEKIHIYHGVLDDVAPFQDSKDFAEKNVNTTLTPLENEKHSYTEEGLAKLCEEIINDLLNR